MVEVRQGAGGEERTRTRRRTRRGGGEEEEEDEEEKATDIKSNNPHLAGGEQIVFTIGLSILFTADPSMVLLAVKKQAGVHE